jgi:hypothetical protein
MKQFYVGWTLKRGIIDPPEPLDPENNRKFLLAQYRNEYPEKQERMVWE